MCDKNRKDKCCEYINRGLATYYNKVNTELDGAINSINEIFAIPADVSSGNNLTGELIDNIYNALPGIAGYPATGDTLLAQLRDAQGSPLSGELYDSLVEYVLAERQRRLNALKNTAFDKYNALVLRYLRAIGESECCKSEATAIANIGAGFFSSAVAGIVNPSLLTGTTNGNGTNGNGTNGTNGQLSSLSAYLANLQQQLTLALAAVVDLNDCDEDASEGRQCCNNNNRGPICKPIRKSDCRPCEYSYSESDVRW